jgi:hypothetical protein
MTAIRAEAGDVRRPAEAAGSGNDAEEKSAVALSVVVPIYNEQDHLSEMAKALGEVLDRVAGSAYWQFVFVNNGRVDGLWKILDEITAIWFHVRRAQVYRKYAGVR